MLAYFEILTSPNLSCRRGTGYLGKGGEKVRLLLLRFHSFCWSLFAVTPIDGSDHGLREIDERQT